MQLLVRNRIEFLIGGAYALGHYTGLSRDTKDFDLMLRPEDVPMALDACRNAGYGVDFTFTHWLAKIWSATSFIDVIFRAGNGLGEVDDLWFRKAQVASVLGISVKIAPPEELIWHKAYVMERERFDGADIIHLLASCAPGIDWTRLIERFGPDWRVLMSHLILFGFVFPLKRNAVPAEIIEELSARLMTEVRERPPVHRLCNGTLLSRIQYLQDITSGGFIDARTTGRSRIKPEELQVWTKASLKQSRKYRTQLPNSESN
jgi:hypothetical protein